MSDLHDPAPDEALAAALAALGPAADEAARLIEAAAATGDWQAALNAIEALASASADSLEGALYAALLAGQARVASALPPGVTPQPPPAVGPLSALASQEMAALPPALRTLYLDAMGRAGSAQSIPTGIPIGTHQQPPINAPLPLAERAAEALRAKRLVTYDQFKRMGDEAKARSLAVAGVVREQALSALQPLLEEQALAPSLASFKRRLREEGLADQLAGRAAETAFRDAVQAAYADGMDRLLDDPLVGDAFPFVERLPIVDPRLSRMCAWASKCGIGGTGIYRRDDPSWKLVRPPSHPNCRCGQNPLTREMAAAKGVAAGRHVTLPELLVKLLRR